jgi:hypothetical protein
MSDAKGVLPHGEQLKRALRWLGERRQEEPAASRSRLIDEAAQRFDLTPTETEFLLIDWKG